MKNLKYNRLLVMSDTLKAGNQFQFQERLNLIKANQNSVGKSTLVKLIFWCIGCDPFLDTTWQSFDIKGKLHFTIDDKPYVVQRYKNIIRFHNENDVTTEYTKITGEYAQMINKLLDFEVILPNKSSNILESPPPAYYFTPYYIDQKKSWSEAWNNFEKLAQYSNWKSQVISYHIGLLSPEYFKIQESIYDNKQQISEIDEYLDKLDSTTEVLDSYYKPSNSTLNENEFLELTEEIQIELTKLSNQQEILLESMTEIESERNYLLNQIDISETIISQLEADYKFAVENVEFDTFECPLCGVEHENSIVNRASILTDKQSAEEQLLNLRKELKKYNGKLKRSSEKLTSARTAIKDINSKYSISLDEKDENQSIIDTIASNSIRKRIVKSQESKLTEEKQLKKDNRDLRKDQKALTTEEFKEKINSYFISKFAKYVKELNAESVNISNIEKPSDHSKIVKEGGAADGNRAVLAYYLTIYSMIIEFGNEVVSPIVIDTPNQNEQSLENYDKIISLLMSELSTSQVLLCAMDNPQLENLENEANVIEITGDKILQKGNYEEIKAEFE